MSKECFIKSQDVHWYGGSSAINQRGNKPRQSRSVDIRSAEMTLVHKPTLISVIGNIPDGHYTKNEMVKLKAELYDILFIELNNKVASALRIRGR